nr:nucleoside-diphosphate sugar epimerase/dehydratase [Fusobacterium gastrosuis]
MENKRVFYISIFYVGVLFVIYQLLFTVTGFSINTPAYGLFVILIFFYSITENLKFTPEFPKYNSVFINAIIFGIFFMFYKSFDIFSIFILFTLFQIFFYRIMIRFNNKNEYYEYKYINTRSMVKFILDSGAIILGMIITYIFKYDKLWYQNLKREYVFVYLGVFLVGYFYTRMNEKSWSYTNIMDVLNLLILNFISAIVFIAVILVNSIRYPLLLIFLNLIIAVSLQLFLRYLFRLKRYYFKRNKGLAIEERVLIYGAGEAGAVLAKESLMNKNFPYDIVGFIDDDPKKVNTYIYDIKVLGNRGDIKDIVSKRKVKEIIIALPSLHGSELSKIVDEIKEIKNTKVKILPSVANLVNDIGLANQIREVKVEDLLGRDEIEINDSNIRDLIENRIIFVTGGAGSIGSELSRQIAKYSPKQLINIDINENAIYFLELEMKRSYPKLSLVSEICSIRDREKLETLFERYKPNIIFHAAAHKHVPLMEHNPEEAIKNNIFGTKNVAECAEKYKVDRMVLISTDKAVNPTNLMGATKRACELVIQNMSKTAKYTKYMAVRFGNVLGSNGSVIPIFRKLIEEGKNLTITHRDITRYFMTIPEAAQLVIEAGALGEGGEIFILDMGKPVKIYDLAKTMIKLSNADVGIDIIGLRPGEKLYEELLYNVNSAIKTENKKIFITKIEDGEVDITDFYDRLKECYIKANVNEIKSVMKELVVSYKEVKYE